MFTLFTTAGMYPFTLAKEYTEQVPAYIALHDPAEDVTILCRYLTETESEKDFEEIVYVKDMEKKTERKPCLLLFEVKSIEQADRIVASYKKGIDNLKLIGDEPYLTGLAAPYRLTSGLSVRPSR